MFTEEENESGLGRELVIGVLPINENPWRKEKGVVESKMRGGRGNWAKLSCGNWNILMELCCDCGPPGFGVRLWGMCCEIQTWDGIFQASKHGSTSWKITRFCKWKGEIRQSRFSDSRGRMFIKWCGKGGLFVLSVYYWGWRGLGGCYPAILYSLGLRELLIFLSFSGGYLPFYLF